jgi:hypothetical protein
MLWYMVISGITNGFPDDRGPFADTNLSMRKTTIQ